MLRRRAVSALEVAGRSRASLGHQPPAMFGRTAERIDGSGRWFDQPEQTHNTRLDAAKRMASMWSASKKAAGESRRRAGAD